MFRKKMILLLSVVCVVLNVAQAQAAGPLFEMLTSLSKLAQRPTPEVARLIFGGEEGKAFFKEYLPITSRLRSLEKRVGMLSDRMPIEEQRALVEEILGLANKRSFLVSKLKVPSSVLMSEFEGLGYSFEQYQRNPKLREDLEFLVGGAKSQFWQTSTGLAMIRVLGKNATDLEGALTRLHYPAYDQLRNKLIDRLASAEHDALLYPEMSTREALSKHVSSDQALTEYQVAMRPEVWNAFRQELSQFPASFQVSLSKLEMKVKSPYAEITFSGSGRSDDGGSLVTKLARQLNAWKSVDPDLSWTKVRVDSRRDVFEMICSSEKIREFEMKLRKIAQDY